MHGWGGGIIVSIASRRPRALIAAFAVICLHSLVPLILLDRVSQRLS